MNLRNALPNASFIGFTGTPLFKDDKLTRRIFGDYVSRYDFKRSVDDGATVPLYYENRGEYLGLKNPVITEQIRAVIDAENEELDSDQRSRLEQLFAREYPILTSHKRLDSIAKDVVWHFCNRGYKGKAMFIALDKLTAVQSLKDRVEKQLKQMVERNPLRVDFYHRYQEIIDAYNSGKDSVTIEETFKRLIDFVNSLSAEEAETKREGLTEEQKAIFDIIRKPELSESEKKKIRKIAIELLDELKKEKLKVEQSADKSVTAAAVFNRVSKTLFELLPYPTYQTDDVDLKTNLVYEHLKHQYFSGGLSIYGNF
jgi:type I site-specific restriction-modification system R (restriction) subunit